MRRLAVAALVFVAGAQARAGAQAFVFRDAGEAAGLSPHLAGIQGHGAAWGDADGDGWLDLYAGTFHMNGAKPNLFFRNHAGKFLADAQKPLQIAARSTGVVFADLDNDGDLDLYIGSMSQPDKGTVGCTLFRNDGMGNFTNISKENGACPAAFGGRSATVLDFDGDGLLDLLVGEDPLPGYNGSETKSSRLFRNKGGLQFEDVSRSAGLPAVPGLGVAAVDVNNDGWPDFFLASTGGGNVFFLNDGHGKFRESPGSREVFAWKDAAGDNMVCGVCFGDVNRDGLLDVLLGEHFQSPWHSPIPNRLYLNRGIRGGVPAFEEITEAAGLKPLPMKAPHVEMQDFDNDGWPDLLTTIVKFKDGKPHPLIFKHIGIVNGLPHFSEDTLAINDFPTAEDRSITRSGTFFAKMVKERKITYTAPGPTGDFDNDGRLDLFLPSWWPELPSLLLHNETPGGNWLDVQVRGTNGVNKMGIGARVKIYTAGKSGDSSALLGCQEISTGFGYASGQAPVAHFGLGSEAVVDLEVTLPHGKGTVKQSRVNANQRITLQR
jgi:hypothetical protein